jgi:transposase
MALFGIDPADETFTVAVYPAHGSDAVCFDNTPDGITAFRETLPEDALVAVENTGVYSEQLCYQLYEAGIRLVLLDPGAVHRAFPRGAKTDPLDAARIAEYAHRYADRLTPWEPHEEVVEQIRVLLATREQFVKQRTAALNAHKSLKHKVVQTPSANVALDSVAAFLKEQQLILEAEIARLIRSHPTLARCVSLLITIPGVKLLLSAQILVLTNGFRDVPAYRTFAQRIGIAPNDFSSGTSVRRRSKSRGYGPPAARKLLHLAGRSVRQHNDASRAYFERKKRAGKKPALVINNLANKVLRVICAVLRTGQPYRPDHVSISPILLTSHRQSG